ncbi:MAG: iron-containing redox enzyme family protein [Nitriliruptor sp.]|uniref:iron-containing redox enzyme family protein n=1 Tax=Nitriliruptor sp. TaxID=2448056 RepID=UPI0034A0A71A
MSAFVLEHLVTPPHDLPAWPTPDDDPVDGDDTHLALYLLYELSYRGVEGVDERWEWHPGLLTLRAELEERFTLVLQELVGELPEVDDIAAFLRTLCTDDASARDGASASVSRRCEHDATLEQVREQAIHRTAWQLKEADPHSWAIPRLGGRPKAALVAIQADEYGDGVDEDVHAELYALTLEQLGLDASPNVYLDLLPGVTLATVNLVSMFGLHRRWLGAVVGHLAVFEMSSVTTMARYATALRRLGFGPWACLFYDTHVVADATHQTIAAHELAGGLVEQDPRRLDDVVFGALALCRLEGRFTELVLDAWDRGESSLLGSFTATDPAPGITDVHVPADDPRRPSV